MSRGGDDVDERRKQYCCGLKSGQVVRIKCTEAKPPKAMRVPSAKVFDAYRFVGNALKFIGLHNRYEPHLRPLLSWLEAIAPAHSGVLHLSQMIVGSHS